MKKSILVPGIAALGLSVSPSVTADRADLEFTVLTAPVSDGAVTVNNISRGPAPAFLKERGVSKSSVWVITADKAGAISFPATTLTYKQLDKMKVVTIRLEPDQSYTATVSAEIANVWLTIQPTRTKDEAGAIDPNKVWLKVVSIVTDNFPDVEVMDRDSYYLRTAWRTRQYPLSVIRSRLVVKSGSSSTLSIKIRLESERAVKALPNASVAQENFEPYDRVLKADKETIDFLRDQL
jgi:hypothetical protein